MQDKIPSLSGGFTQISDSEVYIHDSTILVPPKVLLITFSGLPYYAWKILDTSRVPDLSNSSWDPISVLVHCFHILPFTKILKLNTTFSAYVNT